MLARLMTVLIIIDRLFQGQVKVDQVDLTVS
jgi:hypothetical protein